MKCYADSYCKKKLESPTYCHEHCGAYLLLNILYNNSNMPKRYRYDKAIYPHSDDRQAFRRLRDYMTNVLDNVDMGNGLYIYSSITGNGKTTWACKIMNYYFRKIAFKGSFKCEGLYINVPTFLEDMRKSYTESNVDFDRMLDDARTCKILILDDIGSENPSEWVRERLYTLINERVNNELVTIYTSNVDLETLELRLGSRTVSRIKGSSEFIEFRGFDRRGE